MARLCERPGCSAPASCTYGFDSKRLSVWIESISAHDASGVDRGARAGALCRRHADSMVVPIGWQLDDRRSASAAARGPAPLPPPPRRTARRAARREDETSEQLALLDVPADPVRTTDHGATVAQDVAAEVAASAQALGAGDATHEPEVDDGAAAVVDVTVADVATVDDDGIAGVAADLPERPVSEAAIDATTEAVAEVVAEPQEAAAPWRPVFDRDDDLGGLLQTRSPLLARAFGRRERPRPAADTESPSEP